MVCTSEPFPGTRTLASTVDNPVLEEDVARLSEVVGFDVDVLCDGALVGVVVRDVLLPSGIYNVEATDVLLQTTLHYPVSAMDMFWVEVELVLATGAVPVGAESIENYFGRQWRRYSWHRNTPWQPGRDTLLSHFEFAVARLQRPQ